MDPARRDPVLQVPGLVCVVAGEDGYGVEVVGDGF